ncbi:MAG: type II toxin-antitoxin system VapC family toxin [Dissulfurispiraceae bacterium]|jgi:tRNA(fMet)-specific endonuclease VapC|nr:type II toxin-antitoxin system VapC family toxin [Dissulfurispiraceae bacterium]
MYLLDTDICIYIINKKPLKVIEKIKTMKQRQIKLSSISLAELYYGVSKSRAKSQNHFNLVKFVSMFEVIPFTDADASYYGQIRAYLEEQGSIIGPYDMQIAAQAICHDLILVTNNLREYKRIPGLQVENWA